MLPSESSIKCILKDLLHLHVVLCERLKSLRWKIVSKQLHECVNKSFYE